MNVAWRESMQRLDVSRLAIELLLHDARALPALLNSDAFASRVVLRVYPA